jgi:hypothetical protein
MECAAAWRRARFGGGARVGLTGAAAAATLLNFAENFLTPPNIFFH